MSAEKFAERILEFIHASDYEPLKAQRIAEALGIGDAELGDFHDACKALMKTGRIVLGTQQALMVPPPRGTMTGTFRLNPRGFGFVVPDMISAHGDLYIPLGGARDAITGDHVLAEVRKRGHRAGKMLFEGRIVRVLKRGQSRFVGELCRQFSRWMVVPDGNTLHVPILVGDPGAKGGKPGDHVVVEILKYPTQGSEVRGVILKVLGKSGDPDVDTAAIIEQHQLPGEFADAVLAEARAVVDAYDLETAAADREDLTKQTIITIDPEEVRDFDDAISLTELDDGQVELGVHIADVSYFVAPGGVLDLEAQVRSNSVYLPRVVIPMIPELLSNGLCSLQEREPRLTKSAFITYDDGNVVKTRFANTVIRSSKRLTYEQASAILDGKKGRTSAKVVALLQRMEQLAHEIRCIRTGMLVLEMPEIELVFDDAGAVTDVQKADTSFSHTIIEMFMVEANEAVSRWLSDSRVPHLRRVHGPPGKLSDGTLQRFLNVLGYKIPDRANRLDLQRLLKEVHGSPEAFAVNLAVLRSMQQAEYSPETIGHYALASEYYCHFTSPIRRYPDLTVHRLFEQQLNGDVDASRRSDGSPKASRGLQPARRVDSRLPSLASPIDELRELGQLCSANERRAEAAERELQLVLVLRLLESKTGEVFDGVVTGVANVGVYVQLDRYLIDGLLKFDLLPDDWWEVEAAHGFVIGQRSGRRIKVGDQLKVSIARISIPTRQLDLALAQPLAKVEGDAGRREKRTKGGRRKVSASSRERSHSRPPRRDSGRTGARKRRR